MKPLRKAQLFNKKSIHEFNCSKRFDCVTGSFCSLPLIRRQSFIVCCSLRKLLFCSLIFQFNFRLVRRQTRVRFVISWGFAFFGSASREFRWICFRKSLKDVLLLINFLKVLCDLSIKSLPEAWFTSRIVRHCRGASSLPSNESKYASNSTSVASMRTSFMSKWINKCDLLERYNYETNGCDVS